MSNSYVHAGVLVDAGASPLVLEPFRREIELVILTHCHYDHTAYLGEIAHMCRAKVAIHELDAPGMRDSMRSAAMMFGSHPPSRHPDVLLRDGDQVNGLLVIHTPGHTPGGICLYDREEHLLFSGDTVFTEGSFGRWDLPGGDRRALGNSIERLANLQVEELCPGHGVPVQRGGSRHIAAALSSFRGCL